MPMSFVCARVIVADEVVHRSNRRTSASKHVLSAEAAREWVHDSGERQLEAARPRCPWWCVGDFCLVKVLRNAATTIISSLLYRRARDKPGCVRGCLSSIHQAKVQVQRIRLDGPSRTTWPRTYRARANMGDVLDRLGFLSKIAIADIGTIPSECTALIKRLYVLLCAGRGFQLSRISVRPHVSPSQCPSHRSNHRMTRR